VKNNLYYEGYSSIFIKMGALKSDCGGLWDDVYKLLEKHEADKKNSENRRLLVECFKQLLTEIKDAQMSLFFLSFLIDLTGEIEYFEQFLDILNGKDVLRTQKFSLYNYCRKLLDDKLYFRTEACLDIVNELFDSLVCANARLLDRDIGLLPDYAPAKTALLIVSGFGLYPYGYIKHIADICDFFTRSGVEITVCVTHEFSFDAGRLHLYQGRAPNICGADTPDNTASGIEILKNIDKSIGIYEFNTNNPFTSEVKKALGFLFENGAPGFMIDYSGHSVFAELLRRKYKVAELSEASPAERPETQKTSMELLAQAQKYIDAGQYDDVVKRLAKAYELLKNNSAKASVLEQLVRGLIKAEDFKTAYDYARALYILDGGITASDAVAAVFEEVKSYKNAIFLRQKIYSQEPRNYNNDAKLFRLYLEDKQYAAAAVKNEYFINKPGQEAQGLAYRFYHDTFDEGLSFKHLRRAVEISRETNDMASYAKNILLALSGSLYYDSLTDEEYITFVNEFYKTTIPFDENHFTGYKPKENRIKLGFISGAIAWHPVGYFIKPLFAAAFESERFEYYFYYNNKENSQDDITGLLEKTADTYRFVGNMPHKDISKTILADKIDILIDLNGLSITNILSILQVRLAPVQMTWIGFPLTVPIKNMDYSIVDNVTDPVGAAERFYTEKLLYLPKTFLCYGIDAAADVAEPPFIKNGYITFGSFNNPDKYSDTILKIWGRLFDILKDARLIIRSEGVANEYTKQKLIDKFAAGGVDISRVSFLPRANIIDYYAEYNKVDIILDTYPFNGATTTCDAFLMATPLISLYGTRHVTRVGKSMLKSVGLSDLAASNGDDYVKAAVNLARDTGRLLELNKNLRKRAKASPLFDMEGFKKDFEDAIYKTYVNHFAG